MDGKLITMRRHEDVKSACAWTSETLRKEREEIGFYARSLAAASDLKIQGRNTPINVLFLVCGFHLPVAGNSEMLTGASILAFCFDSQQARLVNRRLLFCRIRVVKSNLAPRELVKPKSSYELIRSANRRLK